jgi:hypothetical protein
MLELLTPEQKKKWEEMTGKPFAGSGPMFTPRPRGLGGPGR